MAEGTQGLPEFHPQTSLRDWGNGHAFRLADALTGVCVFGATGSGKTSGPAKHLAYGYLAEGFGGLVLCAKPDECTQWQKWAADCGRSDDLVIVDSTGKNRLNFLEWEATRPDASGGLTINVVAILDDISRAIASSSGKPVTGGGNSKFWEDALHFLLVHLVELPLLAGVEVSLPTMRDILNSAPESLARIQDPNWQEKSTCYKAITLARERTKEMGADFRADFEESRVYWMERYPVLNEKTRSIITLTFSMLVQAFLSRPLRALFCADTNVRPEDAFAGKVIILDLPVQDFRLAGRCAALAWKYCFQVAVMRRKPPAEGYLRPVFLWADEAQNFISDHDSVYQAVARSGGGATVYLTQNRESYRRVLGNADAVDSFLHNLQCKIFCQNTGETNEWAAKLLGERWLDIKSSNIGRSGTDGQSHSSGINIAEQKRYFVEPSTFTTLLRGGPINNFKVEAIAFNGGYQFLTQTEHGEMLLPYKWLTFDQRDIYG